MSKQAKEAKPARKPRRTAGDTEILRFLSTIMRDPDQPAASRLKAAELLARRSSLLEQPEEAPDTLLQIVAEGEAERWME